MDIYMVLYVERYKRMPMDKYGRLLPHSGKFPSAEEGIGFRNLADFNHGLGLKFGIHIMRGIPRQAVWAKSPIKNTQGIDASMIADTNSVCPWLNLMYGVDMSRKGAQEYYNSLFELYARWGVDFVKVDDIDHSRGHLYRDREVEAIRRAIELCGRPMVLSLSPVMHYENREHMNIHADMWRISADFWDEWEKLKSQFEKCAKWSHISGLQSWPDADMLPVGMLRLRGPFGKPGMSKFTRDEHYTLFTLWAIFRSPLMIGGNMPDTDSFLYSLLTNEEVIRVNQESIHGREIFNQHGKVIWMATSPGEKEHYVAMFNLNDEESEVTFRFRDFQIPGKWIIRDLWEKQDMGVFNKRISRNIPPHGAVLLQLSQH